ncbi:NAD(P)-dependent oxidoreductase [Shouchella shacheensis]|uniref:NAD(P)-dependent oxidoreductase n=1 Tax=Shouchella shacheensis TaxID=1649580 RepID=UPI0007403CE5|nr:NAD(P)-dependent oxidoreductase [Shouchella shacheensis]
MEHIGMIGCGVMGKELARNLLQAGYSVYVCDEQSLYREELEREGVTFLPNVATLAEKVERLLLSLPSPKILQDVLLGENGVLAHIKQGSAIFDMGTTDVQTTRLVHKQASAKGVRYLDCPVSGGPAGASTGTLTIMVGGNEADFIVEKPTLQVIGEKLIYVGPAGSGQTVKLCNNMVVAGITSLLSETMISAEEEGVSPHILFDIIQQSSGHNRVIDVFGSNLLEQSFEQVLFYLGHMAKDLELYMDMSRENQTPQPTAAVVNQLYRTALQQKKGKLDSTAVYSVISNKGE